MLATFTVTVVIIGAAIVLGITSHYRKIKASKPVKHVISMSVSSESY